MKGVTLRTIPRGVSLRVFPAGGSPGPTLQTIRRGVTLTVRGSPGGRVVAGRPLKHPFSYDVPTRGAPSPFLKRRAEAAAETNPAAGSRSAPPADTTLPAGADKRVRVRVLRTSPPLPVAPA
jgi:hypothetical protein